MTILIRFLTYRERSYKYAKAKTRLWFWTETGGIIVSPWFSIQVNIDLNMYTHLYTCIHVSIHIHFVVVQMPSHVRLCDPMDCNTTGFLVLHYLPEFAQTHVHGVGDALQLSHPLLPSPPSAFNLFQHQGLFQWVSSLYQVAKVLELHFQHQSFQWVFRVDFL